MQMQVSKNNIFMRIARFGFFREFKWPADICSLTRRVIASVVIHGIAGILVLALASCLLSGFYGWYLVLSSQKVHDFFGVFAAIDMIIILGVSLGYGITKLVEYIQAKARERARSNPKVVEPEKPKKPKEPALIPLMYKSWKNKFCIKLNVVDV